jgi:ribulose bisphosphate carboxylase small subunit
MLWARVDMKVREVVKRLAEAKGVSVSEYVRSLVLDDLDKRTVFTTILKEREEV